jgi:hypothetical protein
MVIRPIQSETVNEISTIICESYSQAKIPLAEAFITPFQTCRNLKRKIFFALKQKLRS